MTSLVDTCVGIIEIFLVLAAILLYKIAQWKQPMPSRRVAENVRLWGASVESVEAVQFRLQDLEMATNSFSDRNKLGEGGFGIVYKGLIDGQIIAIKKLHGNSVKLLEDIANEVRLLSSLKNDNLVKLLGFCAEAGHYLLVYEYVSNGDLRSWLTDETKRRTLNWKRRFKIIIGIAKGLSYLHHNSQNVIIHCDLKPENILLDEDYNAKVTDFGLSKIFDTSRTHITMRKLAGTPGYMAPELWFAQHCSYKSDVFSYGQLILEILAGSTVGQYAQANEEVLSHFVWKQWKEKRPLLEIIDSSLWDKGLQDQMVRCILIGLLCVQHDPKKRPKLELVLKMLNTKDPLPKPSIPAFFQERAIPQDSSSHYECWPAQHARSEDSSTSIEFRPTERARPEDSSTSVEFQPTVVPKIYSLQDLNIITNNFSCKLPAVWTYCAMYKGVLDGHTIAVERYSDFEDCDISNLVRDINTIEKKRKLKFFAVEKMTMKRDTLLPNMRHPNIISILGYCLEEELKLFVVFIYPTNGRLKDYLCGQNIRQEHSEWRTRVKIIKGVANGICYLHHGLQDKHLIHGNLNPSNILLDDSWNAKLCGFRLTIVVDEKQRSSEHRVMCGPVGYTAPELYSGAGHSRTSDVYSYGMILLEILVRKKLVDFGRDVFLDSEVWKHWQKNKVLGLLDPCLRNSCPEKEALRYFHIALLCIQYKPGERPTMRQVVQMLNSHDALPIPYPPAFLVENSL